MILSTACGRLAAPAARSSRAEISTPFTRATSSAGASVIQLVDAQSAPLAYEQASPLIENFLAGRKRLAVAQDEVKRLRGTARIEYVAQFKQSTR